MAGLQSSLELPVAILAGGLATRLRPLTEKIPKALVEVAGRPFLDHQLALLRFQGVRRVVMCVGYLGGMIQDAYGDGSRFGLELRYSFDGPTLLGTGGALIKALPLLGEHFFVLYGDSYLPVDFHRVEEAFLASSKPGLMTVFPNHGKWDTSNVWFANGAIKIYDKKNRRPEMDYIDYGLICLTPGVFARLPENEPCDLADVLTGLAASNQLAGLEVTRRFYEIGSISGLRELEALLKAESAPGETMDISRP